jgi:hypothetical protein
MPEEVPVGRMAISMISGLGWLISLIIWLFFFAEDLSVYQNIAVFLISLLVLGAINVLIWVPWGCGR